MSPPKTPPTLPTTFQDRVDNFRLEKNFLDTYLRPHLAASPDNIKVERMELLHRKFQLMQVSLSWMKFELQGQAIALDSRDGKAVIKQMEKVVGEYENVLYQAKGLVSDKYVQVMGEVKTEGKARIEGFLKAL